MGISFESIVLLLVLALILFGTEKLPEIAQKIGYWVAKMRAASSDITQQYQQVLNPALLAPPPAIPPLEEFTCPHCSHTMEQRFTFCPHCGRRIEPGRIDRSSGSPSCPHCGMFIDEARYA